MGKLIVIEGLDACACCAPHVKRTGEIGAIKIVSAVAYKGGMRMTFLCGGRAMKQFQKLQTAVDAIARKFSTAGDEVLSAVEKQEAELKALREQLEAAKVHHAEPDMQAAEAAPAGPKMVRIKLPLTRTEKDDVFVGLNGKTYLIKRGVPVDVPEGVAKVLERREKMLSIAMEYEEAAAAPLDQLAQMYK